MVMESEVNPDSAITETGNQHVHLARLLA